MNADDSRLTTVGWCEWLSLPELGLPRIQAKIDTGAKTSCLHAFSVEAFERDGEQWVHFGMHPNRDDTELEVYCDAKVIDVRTVTDSGGHKESRFVISTSLHLDGLHWPIEITLTNRDSMQFRMLLGRQAMQARILVDPSRAFVLGTQAPA